MIQRYAQFQFLRKGSKKSSSITFCVWFFKKIVSHVIFYITWPSFIVSLCCLYFLRYWAIRVLQLLVKQVATSSILKLTFSFWSSFFCPRPKSQDKNVNIFRTKRAFDLLPGTMFSHCYFTPVFCRFAPLTRVHKIWKFEACGLSRSQDIYIAVAKILTEDCVFYSYHFMCLRVILTYCFFSWRSQSPKKRFLNVLGL